MVLTIIMLLVVAPALYTFWRVEGWWAWHLALETNDIFDEYSDRNGSPTFFAHSIGTLVGLGAGVIWPLIACLYVFKILSKNGSLTYTPRHIREQQYRQRIQELERDVLGKINSF